MSIDDDRAGAYRQEFPTRKKGFGWSGGVDYVSIIYYRCSLGRIRG